MSRRFCSVLSFMIVLFSFSHIQAAPQLINYQGTLSDSLGQPAVGLDLQSVRDRIEAWPGIGEVEVELEVDLGTASLERSLVAAGGATEFIERTFAPDGRIFVADAYNRTRLTPRLAALMKWWLKRQRK